MKTIFSYIFLLLLFLGNACDSTECGEACVTTPQPLPMPLTPPNADSVFYGPPEAQEVPLVGLPGAISDIEDTQIAARYRGQSSVFRERVKPDGSFLMHVTYAANQELELWLEQGNRKSTSSSMLIQEVHPKLVSDQPIFTANTVQEGKSEITGTTMSGLTVIAINLSSSVVQSALADEMGSFSLEIAANPGDLLEVFGVSPDTKIPTDAAGGKVPAD